MVKFKKFYIYKFLEWCKWFAYINLRIMSLTVSRPRVIIEGILFEWEYNTLQSVWKRSFTLKEKADIYRATGSTTSETAHIWYVKHDNRLFFTKLNPFLLQRDS